MTKKSTESNELKHNHGDNYRIRKIFVTYQVVMSPTSEYFNMNEFLKYLEDKGYNPLFEASQNDVFGMICEYREYFEIKPVNVNDGQ